MTDDRRYLVDESSLLFTLDDMIRVNSGSPDVCERLRSAKAGDVLMFDIGGGASLVHVLDPRQLAELFVDNLVDALPLDELAAVLDRNREYPPDVCASHDFCDANVFMLFALQNLVGYEAADRVMEYPEGDDVRRLWNEAWLIAKRDYLTL